VPSRPATEQRDETLLLSEGEGVRVLRVGGGVNYLHVVLEHVCGRLDLDDVVDNELAEGCEKVAPLVQLFNLTVLIH